MTVRINDPRTAEWNHDTRCSDRDVAQARASELRRERGTFAPDGGRVRWRVRPCRECHGFFVVRERQKVDRKLL